MAPLRTSKESELTRLKKLMETVTVYRFQIWDRERRSGTWSPLMGTREAIRREKGEADLRSKLQVREDELDANGLYPKSAETLPCSGSTSSA